MRGFTLLELIIVIAIILIGAATAAPFVGQWPWRVAATTARDELVQDLRLAQQRAVGGWQAQNQGLKLFADHYVLFVGADYNSRQTADDMERKINKDLQLSWQLTGTGAADEIIWPAGSAVPNRLGKLVLTDKTGAQVNIIINSLGAID